MDTDEGYGAVISSIITTSFSTVCTGLLMKVFTLCIYGLIYFKIYSNKCEINTTICTALVPRSCFFERLAEVNLFPYPIMPLPSSFPLKNGMKIPSIGFGTWAAGVEDRSKRSCEA